MNFLIALSLLPAPEPSPQPFPQTTTQTTPQDALRLAEIERQIDVLSDELEAMRLGPGVIDTDFTSRYGFGAGASGVYRISEGVSVGGYGELLYTDRQGGPNEADFLRGVLYAGYKFDDHWLFTSEYEFEHATVSDNNDGGGDEAPGSVSVEVAFVEYRYNENYGARAGLLLIPVGLTNELHEPINFPSANRPEVELQIIPTTWRENGVGVFGETENWSWRAYAVNGFDGAGFSAGGIRGGRQSGGQALADDLALTGRVDYVGQEGLIAGISGYYGGAGQNNAGFGTTTVSLIEAHVDWRYRGLRTRALGVLGTVDDVQELNAAQGFTGNQSVGEEQEGFYVEVSYDIAQHLGGAVAGELTPFFRYESLDTQADVPTGFTSNPANDEEFFVWGISWSPITRVALKADYVDADNDAGTGQDLFRLTVGYVF